MRSRAMRSLNRLRTAVGERVDHRTRSLPPARQVRFSLVLGGLSRFDGRTRLDVLDAGAGDAIFAERLARRRPQWRIVAVDRNEAMLDAARRRLSDSGPKNLSIDRADLTGDLGVGLYDVALAIECLVEIPDDDAALQAIARALRPGGRFIAHVPVHDWTPVLPGSPPRWRYEVRHGYAAEELRAKLERVGLEVTEFRPTGRNMVFIGQEIADRIKDAPVRVRAAALPLTSGAALLERGKLTWGPHRALLVSARRV
jgi:SAM-dependent methyltransferase